MLKARRWTNASNEHAVFGDGATSRASHLCRARTGRRRPKQRSLAAAGNAGRPPAAQAWPLLLLSASVLSAGAGASAPRRFDESLALPRSDRGSCEDGLWVPTIRGGGDGASASREEDAHGDDGNGNHTNYGGPSSWPFSLPSFVGSGVAGRPGDPLAALNGGGQDPLLSALSGGGQGSSSKPGGSSGSKQRENQKQQQQQPQKVVELYENEHYDPERETWLSGSGVSPGSSERWTNINGKKTSAPNDVEPLKGYEFASDWKIDVTGAGVRDNLGWEYLWDADGRSGRRRRRWLRTVSPKLKEEPKEKAAEAAKKAAQAAKVPAKKKRRRRPLILDPLRPARAVRDEWNFKGFGWSFYKSLVTRGCGVSFRVPISPHFDWYDRHPALPAVTSSAGLFYPNPTAVVFFNISVHVAVVRYVLMRTYEWLAFGIATALVLARVAVEVAAFPLSALLRAAWDMASKALGEDAVMDGAKTKKSKAKTDGKSVVILGHPLPPLPPPRRIRYSADAEQRVGASVSWRVSQERGYEFRVSYWHIFLPTLMYLGGLVGGALDRAVAAKALDEEGERPRRNVFQDKKLVEYLRRRAGSLGVACGGPNPVPPTLSCSAVLSLSGYFYGDLLRRARRSVNRGRSVRRSSSSSSSSSSSAGAVKVLKTSSSSSASASASRSSQHLPPVSPAVIKKDPVVKMEKKILAGKERAESALEQSREVSKTKTPKKAGGGSKGRSEEEQDGRGKQYAEEDGGEEEANSGVDEKTKVASH